MINLLGRLKNRSFLLGGTGFATADFFVSDHPQQPKNHRHSNYTRRRCGGSLSPTQQRKKHPGFCGEQVRLGGETPGSREAGRFPVVGSGTSSVDGGSSPGDPRTSGGVGIPIGGDLGENLHPNHGVPVGQLQQHRKPEFQLFADAGARGRGGLCGGP